MWSWGAHAASRRQPPLCEIKREIGPAAPRESITLFRLLFQAEGWDQCALEHVMPTACAPRCLSALGQK